VISKPVMRLIILAIAVLLSPVGEPQYARAQPTTSVGNPWNPPQRRRIVLMRHGAVSTRKGNPLPISIRLC
jgi:hypothetical protein